MENGGGGEPREARLPALGRAPRFKCSHGHQPLLALPPSRGRLWGPARHIPEVWSPRPGGALCLVDGSWKYLCVFYFMYICEYIY